MFCSFIISILFFLLFISAPLRLDILLQDEKIARLNQQIHELTVLNRKCDKHRKRQLRFLQALINSFKGDNVPLSENVCTRECQKYNVKSNLCNMLCTATTSTPWSMNDIGGDYKFPCDQNWKKQFNQQIRKYDETNSFLYHTNSNKAREKEKSLQTNSHWDKETFFTLAKLFDDTQRDLPWNSEPFGISKRSTPLRYSEKRYNEPHSFYRSRNQNKYNPYSYEMDYLDKSEEPVNVILSSQEDPDRIIFNRNHQYAKEIDYPETSLPQEPTYVIPPPLNPVEHVLPTDGLNVTVPISGRLSVRDEEILKNKPLDEVLCRQFTCVTNSGFKASVCFLAYDPDMYFSETLPLSNATFGKQRILFYIPGQTQRRDVFTNIALKDKMLSFVTDKTNYTCLLITLL